jgi:hypothetical protein
MILGGIFFGNGSDFLVIDSGRARVDGGETCDTNIQAAPATITEDEHPSRARCRQDAPARLGACKPYLPGAS